MRKKKKIRLTPGIAAEKKQEQKKEVGEGADEESPNEGKRPTQKKD